MPDASSTPSVPDEFPAGFVWSEEEQRPVYRDAIGPFTREAFERHQAHFARRFKEQLPCNVCGEADHVATRCSRKQILDACCGGRFWWWDKRHPLAVYVDNRVAPPGSRPDRPNWSVEPDIVADFRELPFEDQAFQLVLFDPPHIAREEPSGNIANQFGALIKSTEQEDLRQGFSECWRVLARGGTLVFKWAGALERVRPHFPADPIVGTRTLRRGSGLGTRWFIFYKALA